MVRRAVRLAGGYIIKNDAFMREKARRDDPRTPFYKALLSSNTFEDYYAAAGDIAVEVPTYKKGKISAHHEIKYILYNKWIQRI
jgi:hypothetical protein